MLEINLIVPDLWQQEAVRVVTEWISLLRHTAQAPPLLAAQTRRYERPVRQSAR